MLKLYSYIFCRAYYVCINVFKEREFPYFFASTSLNKTIFLACVPVTFQMTTIERKQFRVTADSPLQKSNTTNIIIEKTGLIKKALRKFLCAVAEKRNRCGKSYFEISRHSRCKQRPKSKTGTGLFLCAWAKIFSSFLYSLDFLVTF
jgi:hypothetical protein